MFTAFRERRKNGKSSSSKFHECGIVWRRGRESNPRIAALQAAALPLGHRALEKSAPESIPKTVPKLPEQPRFTSIASLLSH
jgi:hypothetical protein